MCVCFFLFEPKALPLSQGVYVCNLTDHFEQVVRERRFGHVQQVQHLGAEHHSRVPQVYPLEDRLQFRQLAVRNWKKKKNEEKNGKKRKKRRRK